MYTVNWIGKVLYNFHSVVLGSIQALTQRKVHSSSFWVEVLWLLSDNSFCPPPETQRYQNVSGASKPSDIPLHWPEGIAVLIDRSLIMNILQDHLMKFKVGDLVYVKRHSPFIWDSKWEDGFCILTFLTPHSAVLKNTLNGKSRNVNLGEICLDNSWGILETKNITINDGGRKAKLLFINKSLARFEMESVTTEYN